MSATSTTFVPEDAAKLRAENEELAFQNELLRAEARRLAAENRTLAAKLSIVSAESERAKTLIDAIEKSRPWRLIQALRGLMGRRW